MVRLHTTEDVDKFIQRSHEKPVFIFKYSPYCSISYLKWETFLFFVREHPDIPYAKIDVIEQRPLSNYIAEITGVRHQSPQVLAFARGSVVWHASHWNIEEENLVAALKLAQQKLQVEDRSNG